MEISLERSWRNSARHLQRTRYSRGGHDWGIRNRKTAKKIRPKPKTSLTLKIRKPKTTLENKTEKPLLFSTKTENRMLKTKYPQTATSAKTEKPVF